MRLDEEDVAQMTSGADAELARLSPLVSLSPRLYQLQLPR